MNWQTFLGVIIGGLFTFLGGFIQQKRSESFQKQKDKKQLKFKVLYDFNPNKNAIGDGVINKEIFRAELARSLNSIPITFNDFGKVMLSFEKFMRAVKNNNSSLNEKNELLYALVKGMFEDLNLNVPNFDTYSTFFNIV